LEHRLDCRLLSDDTIAANDGIDARIVTPDEAASRARNWRQAGIAVALTNGCFDLIHVGHLRYLRQAREHGRLIVGLNSDSSVATLKGPTRPIVPARERAEMLASLRSVDLVTIFDDLTAGRLLEQIRPNVYVKGADYGSGGRPLPEAIVAARIGARVELIELTPNRSTTALVERIRAGLL
jgi:rfaE bifunctional protein nucleotidyltransferase chain/domain